MMMMPAIMIILVFDFLGVGEDWVGISGIVISVISFLHFLDVQIFATLRSNSAPLYALKQDNRSLNHAGKNPFAIPSIFIYNANTP